jgi:hypothetical protein
MIMPTSQKRAAGAKVVPMLWRDCAWPVRIFVHTRLGRLRLVTRSAAFRLQRFGVMPDRTWGADIPVRSKMGARRLFRMASSPAPRQGRCGQESPGSRRKAKGSRMFPQPEGCAPAASKNGVAQRLRPVLAFAASQLGGLAPSRLRIYSVFELPLPTKL